jgi:hypothetical protein
MRKWIPLIYALTASQNARGVWPMRPYLPRVCYGPMGRKDSIITVDGSRRRERGHYHVTVTLECYPVLLYVWFTVFWVN